MRQCPKSFRQKASTVSVGGLRLLAESASATAPAAVTLTLAEAKARANPIWVLREQPPVPVPAARQH